MADGKCLGYADELLMEAGGNPPGPPGPAAVKALVVKGRRRFFGLFGRGEEYYIPWECIQRIGDDIILIDKPFQRRDPRLERKRRQRR